MGDGTWRDDVFCGGFIVGIARRLFSWNFVVSLHVSFFLTMFVLRPTFELLALMIFFLALYSVYIFSLIFD